jgi:flagellum-specific peptidoglycan hydrolase FlgJ
LYRVRLTWEDSKSQKGAYKKLDSAKLIADENPGYSVFDDNGNVVYTSKKEEEKQPNPEAPKVEVIEPEIIIPAYDLDYSEKNLIVDKDIIRTNEDCAKAIKLIKSYNNKFDEEIAKVFCKIAPEYGIDPLMAIAQSILETGWFKYSGSAVSPSQYNYCGLGVTSNGMTGAAFNNIEEGVRA